MGKSGSSVLPDFLAPRGVAAQFLPQDIRALAVQVTAWPSGLAFDVRKRSLLESLE